MSLKIPRPPGVGLKPLKPYRCLFHVPDLTKEACAEMKKELPSLILTYLDEELSWGRQDEDKKQAFIQAVITRLPCLERYEDTWPVLAYTPEWLSRRKGSVPRRPRREEARSISPTFGKIHNPADVSASTSQPLTRLSNQTRTSTRTSPQRQRQSTAESTIRPPSPSSGCKASLLNNTIESPPTVATAVGISVRRFLAALQPSMQELTTVFALAGVRDRACLEALVAMTRAEQRAFLDHLPLNMFQREVVLNGLAARRR